VNQKFKRGTSDEGAGTSDPSTELEPTVHRDPRLTSVELLSELPVQL